MDSVTNRYSSQQLPFQGLTDYDVEVNFRSAWERIIELMNQHDLVDFLKNNYLAGLFDPRDFSLCNYYEWIFAASRNTMVNFSVCYLCPRCEMKSLYIKFTYHKKKFIIGGIYRHPNGNVKHFISDLETALDKIPEEITVILAGDINIDIIKYDNAETLQYLTTLLSNRFLPYITIHT